MARSSLEQEAISHLQNLIRINTTNPPGNEIEAVRYLARILDREKIDYEIFEPAPGRGNLVARLSGTGAKRPLLLTSHLDVVPAEKKFWSCDPFSGEEAEGCIWGRGAVDMKQMTAMELTLFLEAKRSGKKLSRDLIFAAVADEEAGCTWGSKWLVENHPDLLRAEYAVNEVGGFSLPLGERTLYPVGVAERGLCWVRATTTGEAGHASLPHENQAVLKLAKRLVRLKPDALPFHSNPISRGFLSAMADSLSFPSGLILKGVGASFLNRFIISHLIPDKRRRAALNALFRNTATPSVVSAGEKVNVIPATAEAKIDGRILPGQTVDSFLPELKGLLGDEVSLEVISGWNPREMEYNTPLFDTIAEAIRERDPNGVAVPYVIPGFTDATFLSRLGIACYGFAPVRLPNDMNFSELFHGHDERIPVEGFLFGLRVLDDVVKRICT